ncbi:MAG: hypothetical protein LBL79_15375 [Prevotella sp.]|jgi:hypothetical protein|nr:hypothetical protein [Prevotella sp.]
MRNILLILSLLFLTYSCSSDDPSLPDREGNDPDTPDNTFKPIRIGIRASAKDANIFDDLQFTLYPDRDCNMLEVRQSYDFLIWLVPELDGLLKIMRPDGFTFSWGNSFSKEGEYHTILQGFKAKKMILSDTIIVNIKNKRDILGYNWKDIKESQKGLYGTTDIFDSRYSIRTSKVYENNSPALEIYMQLQWKGTLAGEILKEYQEREQEEKTLNYITGLYGEPKLSYKKDGSAIVDTYRNTFKQGDKTLVPRYIWETNTSRIVLLQIYGIWGEWNSYFAIAEPNK